MRQIITITTTKFIVIFLFIGSSFSQNIGEDIDVADIENKLKENFNVNVNSSQVPSKEELEALLKEKCIKNGGGEEAYNALQNQQTEIQECLQAQLNATEIQEEVEEAKKTGSMDEVFGKYCRKYPEIYKCVETVIDKIKPCLDVKEQATMNKTLDIFGELKEFICFKDGDRIAMFIAEGGVECMESRKEQLQECANKTIGSRIPTEMSLNNLPMLMFTDRECDDFDKIRTCFNEELEKCKDSTPANIVDAFFKFLKKHMPCSGVQAKSIKVEESSSSTTKFTLPAIVLGLSLVISRFM